jgi:hypothetical protein
VPEIAEREANGTSVLDEIVRTLVIASCSTARGAVGFELDVRGVSCLVCHILAQDLWVMVDGKRRFPSDWGSPPTKRRRDYDELCTSSASTTDAIMTDAACLQQGSVDQSLQKAPESREELRARLLAHALQQQSLYRQQCANMASGMRINPC